MGGKAEGQQNVEDVVKAERRSQNSAGGG